MKKVLLLLACAAMAQDAEKKSGVEALAWMAGSWSREGGGSVWEETWLSPRGNSLAALTRWVRGGKTLLYELSVIEQEGDKVVLRLRHFGWELDPSRYEAQGAMSWQLKTMGERKVVFEEPTRAFPKRVVYQRPDDDTLIARLEGAQPTQEFRFKRVR